MPRVIGQLDLFARRPPTFDEARLIARLREVEFLERTQLGGRPLSPAARKRLMTPLPPITVPK
jgi:hypothetical protein